MNKRLITGLVILMGISLLGIIAVQFYWFNNSVKVRDELFDRSVNEALNKAVRKLEINHDIRIIEQFSNKNDTVHWNEAVPPPPPPPDNFDIIIERDSLKQHIKVVAKSGRHFPNKQKLPSIDTTLNFDTTVPVHFRQIRAFTSDSAIKIINDSTLQHKLRTIEIQAGQKVKQLESLSNQIVTEFKGWEAGRDIDPEQIKENIKIELENKSIPITFNYAILAGDSIISTDFNAKANFGKNWYKVNLFPNDIFRKDLQVAIYFPERNAFIGKTTTLLLGLSVIFTIIILLTFILSISFILRQKKISEMKSDFINNMTHEFKTPIATISVASDSILNDKVINDTEKVRFFTGMIKKENKRMNEQVERILQIARLDRKEFDLRFQPVDAHELIGEAIQSISIQVEKRGGKIETKLDATNPIVTTDPVHFINLIYNLLDNANKYSPEKPQIKVTTLNDSKGLFIIVEDHGIGMSKTVMSKIFEKFYRQTTGNIHNIKGFGLGLSYVKAILEANKGNIKVHSEPGKGSRFEVFIPFLIKE
jgi:two-component system, OmpR family, phosphate regulon sensor histidine kinase PhoR